MAETWRVLDVVAGKVPHDATVPFTLVGPEEPAPPPYQQAEFQTQHWN